MEPDRDSAVGIGYTLATGNLWCSMSDFQGYAEELLGRPVWTHEFADSGLWLDLRAAFEDRMKEALSAAT